MSTESLKECLGKLTKDDLVFKMKNLGLIHNRLTKEALVNELNEFLLDPKNIEEIWQENLSPFEKEYIEEVAKYNERPRIAKIKSMHEKYGIKSIFSANPFEKDSYANLFFICQTVPTSIKELLKKHLTPIKIKYKVFKEVPLLEKGFLNIIRESFDVDFGNIINLIENEKLSVTKEKKYPTKNSIIKINDALCNKDFVFNDMGSIDKIGGFEDTNRIYAIIALLIDANLIYCSRSILRLSEDVGTFLKFDVKDKCEYLLHTYLSSKSIFETKRIPESKYKTKLKCDMKKCRSTIINHLKQCPVNAWISVKEFLDYIKIIDKNFLTNEVGYISYFSDKHKMQLAPWVEWEEVEGRFVEVVLQEYLSTLGIVDTAIYETKGGCFDYDNLPFFKVEYIRITPLGASVLGINNDYSSN